MRIYKPQNELGQALLNDGQLVETGKSIVKSVSGGAIVLTNDDVTIFNEVISFQPEVIRESGKLTLTLSKDKDIDGLSKVVIAMYRTSSRGIDNKDIRDEDMGGGNELTLEVLIQQAKDGQVDSAKKAIRMLSEQGEYKQIATFGNELKATGVEEYKYADLADGEYKFSRDSSLTEWDYVLPNLSQGGHMFYNCQNLTSFTSDLPFLTNGMYMFSGCSNLTSFTSDLSSLTIGACMFFNCNSLSSFTGDLSSLTTGVYMFSGCKLDLASVRNIAQTINTYNGNLTLGLGCTEATFDDHSTGWYDAVEAIKSKGWTVAVQYNG